MSAQDDFSRGEYLLLPYAGEKLANLVRLTGIVRGNRDAWQARNWCGVNSVITPTPSNVTRVTPAEAKEILREVGKRVIPL